ncbi:MAG: endonuclease/exonuclease/phosphatase family protein [Gammaproteobacteria bacterium]|jgi:endonuclease/exonuclease/phosphatase family metal-dependent hydrolase|nr:endonuclease/exonuclease/phosphatase family protein [Gammaproteobacteria bacterium]
MITTLTLNVHKGVTALTKRSMLESLRSAVQALGSDLVFLQEVVGEDSSPAGSNVLLHGQSQYEYFADTIWSDFAYGKNAVYDSGHHGNAILSRYPISVAANYDVSQAGDENRGLLYATVDGPSQFHAICIHFGLKEKHRALQSQFLCSFVNENIPPDEPLIVAGDFNDWRLKGHQMLTADCGLNEAFSETLGKPARTFPAILPALRLDRLYTRCARVLDAKVLSSAPWSRLSDHAGLVANIDLSP